MRRILLLKLLAFIFAFQGFSQNSFRFKADIITKVKNSDSSYLYSKGLVFYDSNFKKVVYKMTFPQREIFVSFDTLLYRYVDKNLISISGNPLKPEYSIYHFILNNNISDFGLKNSNLKAVSIERVNDLILTKWLPPPGINSFIGNILISTKDKRLNSVLIFNSKGDLISRQIYKDYKSINGVEIPTEILSVSYLGDSKKYQIIGFRNILINESGNDIDYNFNISQNFR